MPLPHLAHPPPTAPPVTLSLFSIFMSLFCFVPLPVFILFLFPFPYCSSVLSLKVLIRGKSYDFCLSLTDSFHLA